ncbi:MAG TPA: hypothetical protein VNT75_05805 [Symbiobacteriaceae bacterium]|nr:hypothetical protein [Symbiobacteriaceae bacterium]
MTRFNPPAFLDDFRRSQADLHTIWDETLNRWFTEAIAGAAREYQEFGVPADQVRVQFFHPRAVDVPPGRLTAKTVTWTGFPKKFRTWFAPAARMAAYAAAEQVGCYAGRTCRQTDEYVEWKTERDAMGRVTRVTFTCEGPEYWSLLAENDPDLAVSLYRELVSPAVQKEDLFLDKECTRYNIFNKWNLWQGIVHLTHPANSLEAEVGLAATASIVRRDGNGQIITDNDALLAVAAWGSPFRASDPAIGGHVNVLTRLGLNVSLRDPIGLYMDSLNTAGWETPDGTPAARFFTVVRGQEGSEPLILRAVFAVPEEYGYTVGDIRIGGVPIQYGGQIAEHLLMKLTAVAFAPEGSGAVAVADGGYGGFFDKTCTPGMPPHPIYAGLAPGLRAAPGHGGTGRGGRV